MEYTVIHLRNIAVALYDMMDPECNCMYCECLHLIFDAVMDNAFMLLRKDK